MAKETKVTDRNGDERIIKRSKLKIGIITLVVLILLSLIGVGIYFIIQATKSYEYNEDWNDATISEVRDDILDDDPNEIGIYFYSEGSTTSNFMLRDNTDYESGHDGAGALSEVITATQEEVTWYGVKIPEENNELIEELLTVKDDESGEYIFRDDFEYLGSGSSLRSDMWVINTLAGSSDEFFELEDATYSSFSLQVQTNEDDEDNPRDILFYDTSTTDGGDGTTDGGDGTTDGGDTTGTTYSTREATGTAFSVQDGTTMFFNGSQLTGVVNSWETVEVSTDETADDTSDTRDKYHNKYVDWLNELIDHNAEFYA